MKVTRKSAISGKKTTMDINITEDQLKDWTDNPEKLMVEGLVHLSNDERDFLLTGITPEDWNDVFGLEEGEIETYANTN